MKALDFGLLALGAPLAVAVLMFLVPALRRTGKPAAGLSVLAALISFGCSLGLFSTQIELAAPNQTIASQVWSWIPMSGKPLIEFGVHLDGISISMMVVVTLVALCVQVYSIGYMADESKEDFGRYFTYHSLFVFSMLALVVAPNVFQLFCGWELVGLASYTLIGYYWTKPSAADAAVKAFWVTKFADMGLLVGLIILKLNGHSFGWDDATLAALGSSGMAGVVAGAFFFAVVGKSAQFPLHIWLPNAMEGPTPVSALLHAATMVAAGVYLIVRAYPIFSLPDAAPVLVFMAYLGSFTALFAAVVALIQTDIKRVLAYSTMSQLGYMVASLGSGDLMGGYFHLTTHAFFKALLFLAAGSFIHSVHSNEMSDMGGLWKRMKPTSIMFIIGSAALAGIPGLAGWFSKDVAIDSLYESGHWLPWAALIAAAGLTALYMMRVVMMAIFGPPSKGASHAHESPAVMLIPMAFLTVLAITSGYLGSQYGALFGAKYEFHMGLTGILATVVALSGVGLGVWAFRPSQRAKGTFDALAPIAAFIRFSAVDKGAEHFYRKIMQPLGDGVGWFDRYVIDGFINFWGWLPIVLAKRVRRIQSGVVSDYVYALVAGLVVLMLVKLVLLDIVKLYGT